MVIVTDMAAQEAFSENCRRHHDVVCLLTDCSQASTSLLVDRRETFDPACVQDDDQPAALAAERFRFLLTR